MKKALAIIIIVILCAACLSPYVYAYFQGWDEFMFLIKIMGYGFVLPAVAFYIIGWAVGVLENKN